MDRLDDAKRREGETLNAYLYRLGYTTEPASSPGRKIITAPCGTRSEPLAALDAWAWVAALEERRALEVEPPPVTLAEFVRREDAAREGER